MENIENFLISELNKKNNNEKNGIDNLINICETFYNKPANNLTEIKKRNTKLKGDIFECFCKLYLLKIYKLTQVWYYHEIPNDIKNNLNLSKNDMGIDLLGIDNENRYYAIQAKYRNRKQENIRKISITWKQLSTFYALCLNSGPYYKHIIITTADYVRHIGKKTDKDLTINYNKLSKLDHFSWLELSNNHEFNDNICKSLKTNKTNKSNKTKINILEENILEENSILEYNKILSKEELRKARIEYYKKIEIKNNI